MRMVSLFVACIVVGMTLAVHGTTRKVDFSDDGVGQAPRGSSSATQQRLARPANGWCRRKQQQVPRAGDADNTRSRFPVAVVSDITTVDVDLSARFKPVSGRVDQAAGLVWRFQNEDNYYIVRANALENNVVLYKVKVSARTFRSREKAARGKKAQVPSTVEHVAVVAAGPRFEVFFNGKLYEEDTTFTQAKVGLWTKADSVTQFDDITIVTK